MGKASSRFKVFEDYYISKREADDEQLVENLKYYEELERQKLKILLLGTACAGKSTFLRQLRLLYGDQYTDEELVVFLSTIHLNLICSMKILVQQSKQLQISGRIVSKKSFDLVDQYSGTSSFLSKSLLTAIKELWSDPIIKTIWDLREEYGDTYSVDYLFDRCAAIATAGYMPDSTDVSHCYLPTTGVVTKQCEIQGTMFEIYDIGFKRSSKPEWMQFFSTAKAVIYVADLTDYDRFVMVNRKRKNKLTESIDHFVSICNNPLMSKIAVILLLNKHDLFIKKIRLKRIQNVPTFANYRGGDHNAADGVNYILQKFRSQIIHSKKDDVQHIVTNVLDTESANKIILMCKGAIEMISNDEHKGRD